MAQDSSEDRRNGRRKLLGLKQIEFLDTTGLDVVELRRQYGHQISFCGNSDIQVWESGDWAEIRREVLRKLNAARGGGYVFMSDHSVSSAVSGRTYDAIVRLVREYGRYPLRLGEFDLGEAPA